MSIKPNEEKPLGRKKVQFLVALLFAADDLGDDDFRKRLQAQIKDNVADIPKRKRILRHLSLPEIATEGRDRSDWMGEAYQDHGYTMQAIAEYAALHHSTVSRLIKTGNENARNKT